MSDQSFVLPTQLQREYRNVMRDLQTIPALESHLTQIKKKGISVTTAVSIESSFPGLLLPKAPSAYSYNPTGTNSEYSQEAIGEKINSLRKNATEMIKKLIQWIKDRCKILGQALKTGQFKQSLAKLKLINEKSDRVDLSVAGKAMGNKTVEFFDNRPVVLATGALIDSKIEFDYVKDTLHSSNFKAIQVGQLLNHLKGTNARILLTPDLVQYKVKPSIVSTLRAFAIMTRGDSDSIRRLSVEMNISNEQVMNILTGKTESIDYIESMRALDNQPFQNDLIQMVTDIDKAMGAININNIENARGLDPEVFELQTKVIRNTVTMLGEVLQAIHGTMKDMATLSEFSSLVIGLSSKELLTSYIRTGRF